MTVIYDHVWGVTAAAAADRVVVVPKEAARLFARIGLRPPDQGAFDPAELDRALADLTIAERFEAKMHLRNAGLLSLGRPIDTR